MKTSATKFGENGPLGYIQSEPEVYNGGSIGISNLKLDCFNIKFTFFLIYNFKIGEGSLGRR